MGLLGLHLILTVISAVVALVAFQSGRAGLGYGALGFAIAAIVTLIPGVLAAIARRQGAANAHGAFALITKAPKDLTRHAKTAATESLRGATVRAEDRAARTIEQSVTRVNVVNQRQLAATAGTITQTFDTQLDRSTDETVDDVVAVQSLLATHRFTGPAPQRRTDGISPLHSSRTITLLDKAGSKRILGINLGESSVWLALHAEQSAAELTLLESSQIEAERLRGFLGLHGLSPQVVQPELVATGIAHHYSAWFDVSAIAGENWDAIVIGMPEGGGRDLLPVVPLLADRLASNSLIVAAVANESEARQVFERWNETHSVSINPTLSTATLTVLTLP